ncbi:MAG: hypothetical protein AAGB12_03510 [Pseudomonadota bacterium]
MISFEKVRLLRGGRLNNALTPAPLRDTLANLTCQNAAKRLFFHTHRPGAKIG